MDYSPEKKCDAGIVGWVDLNRAKNKMLRETEGAQAEGRENCVFSSAVQFRVD